MLVVPNSFAAIHQELKFAFRHGSNKSKEVEELEYTAAVYVQVRWVYSVLFFFLLQRECDLKSGFSF